MSPRKQPPTRRSEAAAKLGVNLQVPTSFPGDGPEPIVIRHSEIADFRQCPLKHRLSWVDGWHNPSRESGGARNLGTVWHLVMKLRYEHIQACQQDGQVGIDEGALAELVSHVIETAHTDLRETLWWMYDGYVEMYGVDSELEILSVEQTLKVPFHDEDDRPLVIEVDGVRRPVLYSWTTDVLARIRSLRGVFVVDHKSTGQPLGQVDIDLSDQFGLYTVAWRRLGKTIRGQHINQVQTKKLKRPQTLEERYDRKTSIRTPTELRALELDAVDTIYAMLSPRNRRRPYSNPDPRTCGWKCDFKEAHLRMRRNPPAKHPNILKAFGMEQGATHGQGQ